LANYKFGEYGAYHFKILLIQAAKLPHLCFIQPLGIIVKWSLFLSPNAYFYHLSAVHYFEHILKGPIKIFSKNIFSIL